ncbi:MAG: hypothetical protein RR285_05720 [Acinetobacter sp.]
MKKLILFILIVCINAFNIVAQNTQMLQAAQKAFSSGNYRDAIEMYRGVIAVESDPALRQRYDLKRTEAQQCLVNLSNANNAFKAGEDANAESLLTRILRINPADPQAQHLLYKVRQSIKNKKIEAGLKSRMKEILASNNVKALEQFAQKNPAYSSIDDIKALLDYYAHPNIIDNGADSLKIKYYTKFGILYYEYNKSLAADFFEKSAVNGALWGFYNLSITLPDTDAEKDRKQRLLAFAAANGHDAAKTLLAFKYPDLKYNQEIPKSLYQSLQQANRGDVAAQICIHKNKFNIALPNLYLLDDQTAYKSDEDDWQYELGMMYLNGIYVKEDYFKGLSYLKDAAVKGNYTAQYQLVTTKRDHKEPINNALVLCAAINGCKQAQTECGSNYDGPIFVHAKEYIKYLQGLPYDFDDMNRFLYLDADKYNSTDNDARLIGAASNPNSRYDLKKINTLLQIQATWSKATISKIQRGLRSTSNKFHHKLFKKLEKISTSEYETKTNALQLLVNEGYFSNPHAAKEIDVIDFMSTSSAHQEASTVVRKEKQETIHKAQNQNEAYYKKSPRSNMSIGEAQGWCERLGSGWRMATATEIRRIPHLYGRFWTNGGIKGRLVEMPNYSTRYSNNPNDRAGAIAVR